MELSIQQMEELKKIELLILDEIDRICDLHHIKYSLSFGTLLGAIRHKGFIPWDDDIDIMMTKENYDRFIEVVESELKPCFFLAHYNRFENYGLSFAKLMMKDTIMEESKCSGTDMPNGVWVDIFPIFNTSNDLKKRKKQYLSAQKEYSSLMAVSGYKFGKKGISLLLYRVKHFNAFFLGKDKILRKIYNIENEFPVNSNYLICLNSNDGLKRVTFEKELFDNYIQIEFEKKKYWAIKSWDKFLCIVYGDYLKLPPKEKQKPHHDVDNFFVKKGLLDEYK